MNTAPKLTANHMRQLFGRTIWVLRIVMPVYFVSWIIAIPGLSTVENISTFFLCVSAFALWFLGDFYVPVRDWFNTRYEVVIRKRQPDTQWLDFPLSNEFSIKPHTYYRKKLYTYPIGDYVYVIKDASASGYYKIGRTNNPSRRIGRFEVILPFTIHIMVIFQCTDAPLLEKALHLKYANKRVSGEWFKLSGFDVLELVEMDVNRATGYKDR